MIFLKCPFLPNVKYLPTSSAENLNCKKFRNAVEALTGVPEKHFSLFKGCHKIQPGEEIQDGSTIYLGLSLPGGKGGFGSMLRAIGAQIEKTTNREACRDLTGRRLRDINEEQRLKKWLSKKAEREQEKLKRKKERLERLKQQPKHEFHDPEYNKQRSDLAGRIDDALSQGLRKVAPGTKRKAPKKNDDDDDKECKELLKKQCLLLGLQVPSSGSDSSDTESMSDDTENAAGSSNVGIKKLVSYANDKAGPVLLEESSSDISDLSSDSSQHSKQESENDSNDDVQPESQTQDAKKIDSEKLATSNEAKDVPIERNDEKKDLSSDDSNMTGENLASSSSADPIVCDDLQSLQKAEEDSNVDLLFYQDVKDLEKLGLDRLKSVSMSLGLKCGGTLAERAQRLWSVRGLDPKDYPSSVKVKPKKK